MGTVNQHLILPREVDVVVAFRVLSTSSPPNKGDTEGVPETPFKLSRAFQDASRASSRDSCLPDGFSVV